MVSAQEIRDMLDERPDLEPALEAVLEPDSPWHFEDVDVDSGRFGELVSRGVVEEVDNGYRVKAREEATRVLKGEDDSNEKSVPTANPLSVLDLDYRRGGAIISSLALVCLFRLISYPAVFQADAIVLSSNDPYYYRYWVEQVLNNSDITLSTLPSAVRNGEPFLVASLWLATVMFGGTAEVAAQILAWYPLISALLTAIIVYVIAVLVTEDYRIGIAAVLMLAVLPAHAFRTSLGFADHHAFDYLWLAFTLLGTVLTVRWTHNDKERVSYLLTGVIAITLGISGQILAWDAGPLLIIPYGATMMVIGITTVYRRDPVLRSLGPFVLAAVLAAGTTWVIHSNLLWQTALVASAPALLSAGGIVVLMSSLTWNQYNLPKNGFPIAGVTLGGILLYVLSMIEPELWTRLVTQINERLLARQEIAEMQSLFGDSAGWLLLFGFLLLLALPYMVWASWRVFDNSRWTPLSVYAWYFFLLAIIQVRFVGQFSLLVAVFAGLGFIHLAEWVDLARRPTPFSGERIDAIQLPDRRQAFSLIGLFILVAGLSMVQVPVKTNQITSVNSEYDTAAWMADYSNEEGMEYPENYVFSQWGHNRLYNYFVSGESKSYNFARENYDDFITSSNETQWYERLQDQVGFIVTTRDVVLDKPAIGTRLHANDGSRNASTPGLAHYRLVYVQGDGESKVFTLVDGAKIRGEAESNSTVTIRTTVELESYSFEYVREVTTGANGTYSIRVPYSGTYQVGEESLRVPEEAVRNGTTVRIDRDATNTTTTEVSSTSFEPFTRSTDIDLVLQMSSSWTWVAHEYSF